MVRTRFDVACRITASVGHEMGHAFAAGVLGRRVRFGIGRQAAPIRRYGAFEIAQWWWPFVSVYHEGHAGTPPPSDAQIRFITAAGPSANMVAAWRGYDQVRWIIEKAIKGEEK